jgi:hypothetical protein
MALLWGRHNFTPLVAPLLLLPLLLLLFRPKVTH